MEVKKDDKDSDEVGNNHEDADVKADQSRYQDDYLEAEQCHEDDDVKVLKTTTKMMILMRNKLLGGDKCGIVVQSPLDYPLRADLNLGHHHHHHHHHQHQHHHHPYMQKAGDSCDISPQFFLDFPQNFRLRTRNQYCTQAIA